MNESQEIVITDTQLPIDLLEKKMLEFDQVDCPVIHRFGPGVYIREVTIPAGSIAIGHYQKCEHVNVFLKGKITMLNDDGSTIDLEAPMIFNGKPGRKCGYIHEDVVWLNIYPTNETDVETLENTYLDKSQSWKDAHILKDNEIIKRLVDVDDYQKLLNEFGFTEEQARSQSENEIDQIPMPLGSYKIAISNSKIEGKGVFATAKIEAEEIIGPARLNGKRTPIGRYVNHSVSPNAKMVDFNGDMYLVASMNIDGCKGGYLGEEITTDYRENLKLIGVNKCLELQPQ